MKFDSIRGNNQFSAFPKQVELSDEEFEPYSAALQSTLEKSSLKTVDEKVVAAELNALVAQAYRQISGQM